MYCAGVILNETEVHDKLSVSVATITNIIHPFKKECRRQTGCICNCKLSVITADSVVVISLLLKGSSFSPSSKESRTKRSLTMLSLYINVSEQPQKHTWKPDNGIT